MPSGKSPLLQLLVVSLDIGLAVVRKGATQEQNLAIFLKQKGERVPHSRQLSVVLHFIFQLGQLLDDLFALIALLSIRNIADCPVQVINGASLGTRRTRLVCKDRQNIDWVSQTHNNHRPPITDRHRGKALLIRREVLRCCVRGWRAQLAIHTCIAICSFYLFRPLRPSKISRMSWQIGRCNLRVLGSNSIFLYPSL